MTNMAKMMNIAPLTIYSNSVALETFWRRNNDFSKVKHHHILLNTWDRLSSKTFYSPLFQVELLWLPSSPNLILPMGTHGEYTRTQCTRTLFPTTILNANKTSVVLMAINTKHNSSNGPTSAEAIQKNVSNLI
jgi:hypothetical protein